jgi:hypothetical protein
MSLSLLVHRGECGCILLQKSVYAQCIKHFQMQNMMTWYLYMVSAIGMVQLLQWNIGGDNQITEFLITPHFQMCTEL